MMTSDSLEGLHDPVKPTIDMCKSDVITYKIERYIKVSFQKEGIHRYPQALTDPALESVKFLGYDHRHIFHFSVQVSVNHNDRDIEFIMLKRELESLYGMGALELNHKSCEMLAEDLLDYVNRTYPGRVVIVEVSEDNENSAILKTSPL